MSEYTAKLKKEITYLERRHLDLRRGIKSASRAIERVKYWLMTLIP